MGKFRIFLVFALITGLAFAAEPTGLAGQLCAVKSLVLTILPTVALLLILLGGLLFFPLLIGGILIALMLKPKKPDGSEAEYNPIGLAIAALAFLIPMSGIFLIIVVVLTPFIINALAPMAGPTTVPCT